MSSQREKDAVTKILRGIDGPVIVELGAHVGEEHKWLSKLNPSRYVMVEPDLNNWKAIADQPNIQSSEVYLGAIAPHNGTIRFNASENNLSINRASGSIRTPTGHLKYFPEVSFRPIAVPCWTFDFFTKLADISNIDLLWCDIQGAERDMIAGGKNALAHTRYMMIEAEPEVELYEGQALKPELLAMLPEWEVIEDFGYNVLLCNKAYVQPVR